MFQTFGDPMTSGSRSFRPVAKAISKGSKPSPTDNRRPVWLARWTRSLRSAGGGYLGGFGRASHYRDVPRRPVGCGPRFELAGLPHNILSPAIRLSVRELYCDDPLADVRTTAEFHSGVGVSPLLEPRRARNGHLFVGHLFISNCISISHYVSHGIPSLAAPAKCRTGPMLAYKGAPII